MRAILSVYDKTGIAELASGLHELGWQLFSTGKTQATIAKAGVPVESVAELTGSPEILGGRVKTLHPKVHGGLLARRDRDDDRADLAAHAIEPVDLVAGNLYPFIQTVTGGDVTLGEALEEIDIGGPTMIRAAAKNHPWVIPLVDPADYRPALEALRAGGVDAGRRRELAAKAFAHVSHYDAAIAEYLRGEEDLLPEQLTVGLSRVAELRYGENPHQRGAFYTLDSVRSPVEGIGGFEQHHGKGLSYVNLLDADAAYNLVADCEQPAVAIIKHTNPCCFAAGDEPIAKLYERALSQGDAVSAYGGIVAGNRPIDLAYATALREVLSPITGGRMFFEIVIAPGFEEDGLEHLRKKSTDLRILTVPAGDPRRPRLEFKSLRGGMLVQQADLSEERDFEVVSERQPSEAELADHARAPLLARLQAREIERDHARQGRRAGRRGRRPAEPRGERAAVGAERGRAGSRGGACFGRVRSPVPGLARGRGRIGGRDRCRAPGRLDPRRGLDRRRERARDGAGHDRRAPLPPLAGRAEKRAA